MEFTPRQPVVSIRCRNSDNSPKVLIILDDINLRRPIQKNGIPLHEVP